ncbi:hypothetical protein IF2G_03237 [Cordyceps javanica]|nr:hypothetical protein IF2G_03237 [Cordyceps javanica]
MEVVAVVVGVASLGIVIRRVRDEGNREEENKTARRGNRGGRFGSDNRNGEAVMSVCGV